MTELSIKNKLVGISNYTAWKEEVAGIVKRNYGDIVRAITNPNTIKPSLDSIVATSAGTAGSTVKLIAEAKNKAIETAVNRWVENEAKVFGLVMDI